MEERIIVSRNRVKCAEKLYHIFTPSASPNNRKSAPPTRARRLYCVVAKTERTVVLHPKIHNFSGLDEETDYGNDCGNRCGHTPNRRNSLQFAN